MSSSSRSGKSYGKRVLCLGFVVLLIIAVGMIVRTSFKPNTDQNQPSVYDYFRKNLNEKEHTLDYPNGDTVFVPGSDNLVYDEENSVLFYNNLLSVHLMRDLNEAESLELAEIVKGEPVGQLHGSINILQIKIPDSEFSEIEKMAEILLQNDDVLYASHDYPMNISNENNPWSNDPSNPETDIANENAPGGNDWWAEAIQAYSAWNYQNQCNPIKVGVLDNGFDLEHEDLKNQIQMLPSYPDNSVAKHGTHVAGLIAAKDNNIGIRGVACHADLIAASFVRNNPSVNLLSTGEYCEILKSMIENEAKVINNSWGVHISSQDNYIKSMIWNDAGYFDSISNTDIALRVSDDATSKKLNVQFLNSNSHDVEFYINKDKVSFKQFQEKVPVNGLIRFRYDKDNTKQVAQIYWIKPDYDYHSEIAAYKQYVLYAENYAKNTGLRCIILISQLIMQQKNQFLIVQSAGNGFDNGGDGYDAKLSAHFNAIDEDLFEDLLQMLNPTVQKKLSEDNITYQEIKNHVIIVGAVENVRNDAGQYQMTGFSNFGNTLDICAPGQDVFSTVSSLDNKTDAPNNEDDQKLYQKFSGTSMSAPIVSGSAAYIWSIKPELTAGEVKEILCQKTSSRAYGVGGANGQTYPMLNLLSAVKEVAPIITKEELLTGYWDGSIQDETIYKFREDQTVDIYCIYRKYGNLGYSFSTTYDLNGNILKIGDLKLEFITKNGPIKIGGMEWNYGVEDGDAFFLETDWVDSNEPSDQPLYLKKCIGKLTPDIVKLPNDELYQDVLNRHVKALKVSPDSGPEDLFENADLTDYSEILASAREYMNYGYMQSDENFYLYTTYVDLNGDGIDELLIGGESEGYTPSIYNAYTIQNNKAVQIFPDMSFGYRTNLWVCDNNILCIDGSSGVWESSTTYYKLTDKNTIELIEEYGIDGEDNFYHIDKNNVRTSISESEWEKRNDVHGPDCTDSYTWTKRLTNIVIWKR